MPFQTKIHVESASFKARYRQMQSQVNQLHHVLNEIRNFGFQKKEASKYKKLPVRTRVEKLLDAGSHFMELSPLAGHKMYPFQTPAASLITGVGSVMGRECMIVANDPSIKGGSYLPMTVKKQLRAQEIALENHLPCIYLVDSGGAYLPLQSEIFPDEKNFGAFFYNQSQLSALGIEQISIVFGLCTAGGAYIPALSDQIIMVRKQSAIFLGGPPLVFSVTGEKVNAEELGGADLHCQQSGLADYSAESEEEAIEKARSLLKNSPEKKHWLTVYPSKEPLYDPKEIYGIIPENISQPFDIKEVIARVVDGSEWEEFKEHYGTSLFTAQTRICGFPVGIVGNQGILFGESALKGSHFIDLCDRKKIPLLFFQNVPGFMVGKKYETEGIAKHGAKMVSAVSLARVPKLTVIIGASFGAGNYAMCGRAYHPRQLWIWPSGRIGVMGANVAKNVLSSIGIKSMSEKDQQKLIKQYENESSPYYSSARLWDDGLIDPLETRKVIAMGIQMALNAPLQSRKKGIYRM